MDFDDFPKILSSVLYRGALGWVLGIRRPPTSENPDKGHPGFGVHGSWLGEVPAEVEGTFAVTEVGGVADGFGDEVLGSADSFDGGVAEDEEAEQRGGEGAAGSVGGGRFDVLAGESVNISRG